MTLVTRGYQVSQDYQDHRAVLDTQERLVRREFWECQEDGVLLV